VNGDRFELPPRAVVTLLCGAVLFLTLTLLLTRDLRLPICAIHSIQINYKPRSRMVETLVICHSKSALIQIREVFR